jgi:hypothetical protein
MGRHPRRPSSRTPRRSPPRSGRGKLERVDAPRFLLDGMLIRLGKYLRCAGYDAVW